MTISNFVQALATFALKIKNDKKAIIFQYKILHNTLIFQLTLVSLNPKYVIMKYAFNV